MCCDVADLLYDICWMSSWEIFFPYPNILGMGVYFRWNGMVEWNSGMDYWNGGMLHRTYLIIQHVLYSEQWALRCVLCMHCWTHSPKCGCWALTCPHRAHKKANARAIVTELFSLADCTHTVCENRKMTICNQVWDILWCLVALHAPESKGVSCPGSFHRM